MSSDLSSSLASHLISTQSNGENLVFSPLSIHVVLALTAAGSGGPTRDQLLAYFKSNSVDELKTLFSQQVPRVLADGSPLGGPRLSFANGVWIDRSLTFKPDFKRIVENDYKAASNRVDFKNKPDEVIQEVNAWAGKETNGLINDILPPKSVNKLTELLLANAIYFKGVWDDKFDSSLTKDHKFYLMNGTSVKVPFMSNWNRQLIRSFDSFKVLTMPYEQGQDKRRRFSMHIFLPDAKDGLPALVKKFGSEVDFVNNHLPREYVEVRKFLVPKFKMNFGFEATKLLKRRGLDLMFEGGLTEMVYPRTAGFELGVSKFFHKSFIEVNEEGTEAAAVSVESDDDMGFSLEGYVEKIKIDFVADHPFLFVVREDVSGVVVFIGQVTNPMEDVPKPFGLPIPDDTDDFENDSLISDTDGFESDSLDSEDQGTWTKPTKTGSRFPELAVPLRSGGTGQNRMFHFLFLFFIFLVFYKFL